MAVAWHFLIQVKYQIGFVRLCNDDHHEMSYSGAIYQCHSLDAAEMHKNLASFSILRNKHQLSPSVGPAMEAELFENAVVVIVGREEIAKWKRSAAP